MKRCKTIIELRENLAEVFDDLSSGKTDTKVASELNNCAGKIIKTIAVQLEYYKLRKDDSKIKFME